MNLKRFLTSLVVAFLGVGGSLVATAPSASAAPGGLCPTAMGVCVPRNLSYLYLRDWGSGLIDLMKPRVEGEPDLLMSFQTLPRRESARIPAVRYKVISVNPTRAVDHYGRTLNVITLIVDGGRSDIPDKHVVAFLAPDRPALNVWRSGDVSGFVFVPESGGYYVSVTLWSQGAWTEAGALANRNEPVRPGLPTFAVVHSQLLGNVYNP